jgi:hypothetical protein
LGEPGVEALAGLADVFSVRLGVPHLDDLAGADEYDFALEARQLRQVRRNRDPSLVVDCALGGVSHELEIESPLPCVDSRLLALETLEHLAPADERIEEQARTQPARGDERLAGFTAAEARREADAALLIDGVGVLTEIRRRRSGG